MARANPSNRVKQILLPREKSRSASQTVGKPRGDRNQKVVAPPREPASLSGYTMKAPGAKGREHSGMDPHNQRSIAAPRTPRYLKTNVSPRLAKKKSAVG